MEKGSLFHWPEVVDKDDIVARAVGRVFAQSVLHMMTANHQAVHKAAS